MDTTSKIGSVIPILPGPDIKNFYSISYDLRNTIYDLEGYLKPIDNIYFNSEISGQSLIETQEIECRRIYTTRISNMNTVNQAFYFSKFQYLSKKINSLIEGILDMPIQEYDQPINTCYIIINNVRYKFNIKIDIMKPIKYIYIFENFVYVEINYGVYDGNLCHLYRFDMDDIIAEIKITDNNDNIFEIVPTKVLIIGHIYALDMLINTMEQVGTPYIMNDNVKTIEHSDITLDTHGFIFLDDTELILWRGDWLQPFIYIVNYINGHILYDIVEIIHLHILKSDSNIIKDDFDICDVTLNNNRTILYVTLLIRQEEYLIIYDIVNRAVINAIVDKRVTLPNMIWAGDDKLILFDREIQSEDDKIIIWYNDNTINSAKALNTSIYTNSIRARSDSKRARLDLTHIDGYVIISYKYYNSDDGYWYFEREIIHL